MHPNELLAHALRLPPGERERYVDEQCGTNFTLLKEVRRLLAEAADQALPETCDESRAALPATHDDHRAGGRVTGDAGDGVQIGELLADKYRIRERVGEGGMGAVYIADQVAPVQRRVAIKLIKAGMDSAQVLHRFAQERQALALMDHPNIARIHDGGLTRAGRPFFVMELVRGLPLTQFCDEARLDIRSRLALLVPVCQAVQHAHQKGIIHRDLKPSNILVGLVDGKPTPKIIDFGVAKALHQGIIDESVYTALNMIVGTLEYMAPEQAGLSSMDIDTRADIYSLGVVMYELLCGTLPFSRGELQGGLEEVIRVIREVEPKRPSTRVTQLKDSKAVATRRLSEPAKLTRQLKGELDWVVMKCLAKERDRRYVTAQGLAADLERYLRDEPVLAAPPSARYRFGKFLRRHRGKVAMAAASVLLLAAAAVVSTVGWVRALHAERQARDETAVHQALVQFIQEDLFEATDPKERARFGLPADAEVKLRLLLDRASQRLQAGRFQDQPLVEAALRLTLAKAYSSLGMLSEALRHADRADQLRLAHLGESHPQRLDTLLSVARILYSSSEPSKADEPLAKVLAGRQLAHGAEHPTVLEVRGLIAGRLLQANKLEDAGTELVALASTQKRVLGEIHEETLRTEMRLADLKTRQSQFEEAEKLYRDIVERIRQKLGENHPSCINAMNGLANLLHLTQRFDEAGRVNEKVVAQAQLIYAPDHPLLAVYRNNLATNLMMQKEYAGALNLLRQIEPDFLRLGETHMLTLVMRSNLASVLAHVGRHKESLALYEKLLPQFLNRFGEQRTNTCNLLERMATVYLEDGQSDKAVATLRHLLKCRRLQRPKHPEAIAGTAMWLADLLEKSGELAKAESLLIEVMEELPAGEAKQSLEAERIGVRKRMAK